MADFDIERLPGELVIRQSGIWNTRAPFHHFLAIFKIQGRALAITTMCYERIDEDLLVARAEGKTLEEFLIPKERNRSAKRAWRSYVRTQTERNLEGVIKAPIYSNARRDLVVGHELMRRGTIIATLSLFESYIQCWLLNYLLTKLERGDDWSSAEKKLAIQLSPVHGVKGGLNLAHVMKVIPLIRDTLGYLNHDGGPVAGTIPPQFSCFDSITFWRQYRNGLVHNRGFCTPRLFEQQGRFWSTCMSQFKRDEFGERKKLTLSTELMQNCLMTVYRSAKALEGALFRLSNGRRGHPWAPEPLPTEKTAPPQYANKLLVEGDHDLSLRWQNQTDFRDQFKMAT